jgi:uncharacterized protein YkwD
MVDLARLAKIAGAIFGACAITWCIAQAGTIPTVVDGKQTLVAVEPLLQTLQLGYVITGTTLVVDGRRFPQPLVERDGMSMADAATLAQFLHLSLTRKNGTLVFATPQSPDASGSAPPSAADLNTIRSELLDALNEHRSTQGLTPLQVDPIAERAAQYQADDMSANAVMRHQDASGRTPMQRYDAMGGNAMHYAENVGWYGLDVTGGADMWKAVGKLDAQMMAEQPPDDGHRRNILSGAYDAVGIGLAVGPHGLYLAEDFVGP